MTSYSYRALTQDGIEVRGVVQAVDEYAAAIQIRERCPVITSLSPVKTGNSLSKLLRMEIGSKRVKSKALALMCSQFAITLRSGLSVGRAMEMIGKQTEDKRLRQILLSAAEDIQAGNTVAASLGKYQESFPATFLETVRGGEQSGRLDEAFQKLQIYFEKSYKTTEKIRSAMTYPIFVVLLAIVVLIVVMAKVIPALAATFSALGGNLPLLTRILIAVSGFFAKWWLLMIIVLLLALILWKLYTGTEKGRELEARLLLELPVIGRINLMNGSAQFANTLSVMLGSGLTINNAVEVTAKTMDNYLLQRDLRRMIGRIEEGRSIGECIRSSEHFPGTLKEMTAVGEESGALDRTLAVIGDYFSNEADYLTQQAIARLEPTLLVILAIFAGFIIFAIYLPIFTMYNLM